MRSETTMRVISHKWHGAKSRYQRRKMKMQAKFIRRLFLPFRAFREGFFKGLGAGR